MAASDGGTERAAERAAETEAAAGEVWGWWRLAMEAAPAAATAMARGTPLG
jgi:hypothetical protein